MAARMPQDRTEMYCTAYAVTSASGGFKAATTAPALAFIPTATNVPVTAANHNPTAAKRATCWGSLLACAAAILGVVRNTRNENTYVASEVANDARLTAPNC
jgi:hypothetical protein